MDAFSEFLRQRLSSGGFSTEDALATLLPLFQQVWQVHANGRVAPLEGSRHLHVEQARLWFPESESLPPRLASERIEMRLEDLRSAVEVVRESRRVSNLDDGSRREVSLQLGTAEAEPVRPVFVPGYLCWEQLCGHHDAGTDVFCLGQLLASLACHLDFHHPGQLEQFVAHRNNLFRLQPNLHPVVARVIQQMTELDPRRRIHDLRDVLDSLENYRHVEVDLDSQLASDPAYRQAETATKQELVLTRLRERLFDITRRNRMLHFRATLQSVNLTHASVPLSFDVRRIRADQILTWNEKLQARVARGKPLTLNSYLNFAEALYLPSQLDRILADARRDQAEYGFAQLRLVACFLNWVDLTMQAGETPAPSGLQRYESPLVLIPVKLTRKKGVRDTYTLEPLSSEAEINPVIRFLFHQRYDIDLPETIDLEETSLRQLHHRLAETITHSEPAVSLALIDRPRIELVHEKAKRRLDQYRRKARISGRGVRTYLDVDYSYDPANYHPLGIKLFESRIRAAPSHLRELFHRLPGSPAAMPDGDPDSPRDRSGSNDGCRPVESPPPEPESRQASPEPDAEELKEIEKQELEQEQTNNETPQHEQLPQERPHDLPSAPQEHERSFYRIRDADGENPYNWSFDLCSVTLANFRYRKMSLVRDYDSLLADPIGNEPFQATFSLSAPAANSLNQPPPLEERFDVVPCDPTQALAVAEARRQSCYIIQGPPGTGKSQTITNLIADFVARGQRVLFVCEKRAAIDVVHARLRHCGLGELCSLIHDSQTDKKAFVMDLKHTYEAFQREDAQPSQQEPSKSLDRHQALARLQRELRPLEEYARLLQHVDPAVGVSNRELLNYAIRYQAIRPELTLVQQERLPEFASWLDHQDAWQELLDELSLICPDNILTHHPWSGLATELADDDRPLEAVATAMQQARDQLSHLEFLRESLELPGEAFASVDSLKLWTEYLDRLTPLVQSDQVRLLEEHGPAHDQLEKLLKKRQSLLLEYEEARARTGSWRQKLSARDTRTALEQARGWEGQWWATLRPSWWRLRRVLHRAYDFSSHQVAPSWTQILSELDAEYSLSAAADAVLAEITSTFAIQGSVDRFVEELNSLRSAATTWPRWMHAWHRELPGRDHLAGQWPRFQEFAPTMHQLTDALSVLDPAMPRDLPTLRTTLDDWQQHFDKLPEFIDFLAVLRRLPPSLQTALRTFELTPRQLLAAMAETAWQHTLRHAPKLERFSAQTHARQANRVRHAYETWMQVNAGHVRGVVCRRFLEHLAISNASSTQLDEAQKEFKKKYRRGRRELEHEFGKSMRYKSIRDLVADESGIVVRDLKPIWLMSPLSVSDTLPLNTDGIDVVIFDEASQITLEEAVPSLFRAAQTIVVGDEMQLPPTDFFATQRERDDDEFWVEEQGEQFKYDLSSNSLLNHAARNLPSTMLGWHYRSRSESLISFSNWAFYHGRLLTVPDEQRLQVARVPLLVPPVDAALSAGNREAEQPREFVNHAAVELLKRPVSFHYLSHGLYEKRCNRPEADYIARLVRQLLRTRPALTIGVVAFSEAQQGEIEAALKQLANQDVAFRERLDAEAEREDDGQFVGLLVKNLENIQGDERDIVILSVCYGPDRQNRTLMNFGPINRAGGEKRLNVAFSRAKHHMVVVSSMQPEAITNEHNDGAFCLKNYLRYAAAISIGDSQATHTILRQLSTFHARPPANEHLEFVAAAIAERLEARGYCIDRNVGQSHFRCDLAIYREDDTQYRLGILVDRSQVDPTEVLERDVLRPKLLENFGWDVMLVLAKDWYANPEEVLDRIDQRAKKSEAVG